MSGQLLVLQTHHRLVVFVYLFFYSHCSCLGFFAFVDELLTPVSGVNNNFFPPSAVKSILELTLYSPTVLVTGQSTSSGCIDQRSFFRGF